MTGEELRQKLNNGQIVYGTMLFLARNPRWARLMAGLKVDYIIIDNEHAAYSRGEVADFIAALDAAGIAPIVRVPFPSPHHVRMALDAGAHGVLVPYCETVAEVKEVVGAARWRPLKGALLNRAIETGELPSQATREYLHKNNRHSFVMIGIESAPGLENLEAIVQVKGIDVIFVGPNDLTISMGIPDQMDHPRYEEALRRVIKTCAAQKLPVAIHLHSVEAVTKWVNQGARFVLYTSDTRIVQKSFSQDFEAIRRRVGDT